MRFGVVVGLCVAVVSTPALGASYTVNDMTPGGLRDGESVGLLDVSSGGAIGSILAGNLAHAVVYSAGSGAEHRLDEGNYVRTVGRGAFNEQFVGWGSLPNSGGSSFALMWNGVNGEPIDLTPPSAGSAALNGTDGTFQVGVANYPADGGRNRATLWRGSAVGTRDLSPAGFTQSVAVRVHGGRQVGHAWTETTATQAMLWSGTAESAVNLHPSGAFYQGSSALDIAGAQQVGYAGSALIFGPHHAMLWTGTTASAVDLHPQGYAGSQALGTNGLQQVGYAALGGFPSDLHAMLWNGSATDFIDLHLLLPPGFTSSSAGAIDESGNVFGSATDAAGRSHAIQWVAVPEPAGLGLLTPLLLAIRRRPPRR